MDPSFKKPKRRPKRKRNPPPPIFNSDKPTFNPMPFDGMPSMSVFPGNRITSPAVPLDPNEMYNRFNQLLDWRLPQNTDNIRYPNEASGGGYSVNDYRDYSPPREERHFSPPRSSKRRITDVNDLRNRLDQQQHKRRKDIDDRIVNNEGRVSGNSDSLHGFSRFDKDDRRDYSRLDIDDRGSHSRADVDDRGDPNVNFSGRISDHWLGTFEDDNSQDKRILRGDRTIINKSDLQQIWSEQPDQFTSGAPNVVPPHSNADYGVRPHSNTDYVVHPHSNTDYVVHPHSNSDYVVRPHSNENSLDFDDRNVRLTDDRIYSAGTGNRWTDDIRQDYGRQVKEYWPSRNPPEIDPPIYQTSDRERAYSDNRGFSYVGVNEGYERALREELHSQLSSSVRYDHYSRENDHVWQKERELYTDRYDERSRRDDYAHGNYMPSSSSFERSRNPVIDEGNDYRRPPSHMEDRTKKEAPTDDLLVIIHKPEYAKITFEEADQLRGMIIDLVVKCGDPDQTPEFVSSGLMRGGRSFYVICRSRESLEWLVRQKLPKLNNVELTIRQNKVYETVKISAFAPRCKRTREEIVKLIKLQNAKKGFDFSNWTLRSYHTSQNGIYFAFDISIDEALKLKEYGCQLSFELKSLSFKISSNIHSEYKFSDFPV